jgi:hypothetical protein
VLERTKTICALDHVAIGIHRLKTIIIKLHSIKYTQRNLKNIARAAQGVGMMNNISLL